MSDDDDRMDRARRIRQMREGQRGGNATNGQQSEDEQSDDQTGEEDAPSTAADTAEASTVDDGSEPSASDESDADSPDDESAWFDDEGNEQSEAEGEPETAAAAAAVAAAEFEDGGADESTEDDTGADGESESAAAAAAAAAAQFESDTADDEEPTQVEPPVDAENEDESEEEVRVLEFELGDERYCLDIMYVEEIVKEEQITRVPNTPEFVRGVVDLRGQITTILDPKKSIGIDGETSDELIVVFDGDTFEDQGHIGWVVDEVRQVTPVTDSEVKESPVNQDHVNGVIERDDEFVIWTRPEIALAEADAKAEAEADS